MRSDAESIPALVRGFRESRVLLTAAQLDLFTHLERTPRSAAQVTAHLRGDPRAVAILLDALAALDLLRKSGGRYRCPPAVARLLSSRSPHTILPMALHSASLWERWSELTGLVRGDPKARARAHAPRGPERMEAFIGAMDAIARVRAPELVEAVRPGEARSFLDIGGASGTYTIAFLRASPHLQATLFDLPPVIVLARRRLARQGLLRRVTLVAGDFYRDPLPERHDLALLSAIIHQNSRSQNVALYGKALRALRPGGRLIVRDHVMNPDRTRPRDGAIFAVNMLCGTTAGGTYTFREIREDLKAAGFGRVRLLQRGDDRMNGVVEALRPARS